MTQDNGRSVDDRDLAGVVFSLLAGTPEIKIRDHVTQTRQVAPSAGLDWCLIWQLSSTDERSDLGWGRESGNVNERQGTGRKSGAKASPRTACQIPEAQPKAFGLRCYVDRTVNVKPGKPVLDTTNRTV
ncbi:hypothetical protein HC028_17825 [Planosporangium flavigriseum]|uniref:Uncharacterized protein n=1 Tax=Planosporangium flavigriseum TaxID=373681 RepID=A0A8J3LR32_9ACTN|nr:hypothetical protein [Planosporangium flavigriseum]NJC66349.1 hypothetical protein [Planosporangium flavigriseum]GIG75260.1 hypothetical protein Pfl04_36640 [Planosporangium flavigriseum]